MEFNFDTKVSIFSSEITDGSMALFNGTFDTNSKKYFKKIGVDLPVVYCEQHHGSDINFVTEGGSAGSCDGALTQENLIIAVRSADCVPIMYFDGDTIGAIHCGRKSLANGIIKSLENFSLPLAKAKIFLGPHIRVNHYEVGDDVISGLQGTRWEKFLIEKSSKMYFDMTGAVFFALDQIGIKGENVLDCGIDTYNDSRFFSARRDPQNREEDIKTFITVIYKNGSE